MSDIFADADLTDSIDADADDEITESTVEISPETQRILGFHTLGNPGDDSTSGQSRTIHLRDRDLKRHNGTAVCRLTKPVLTVTQAVAPATGLPYLIVTFRYEVTSLGYRAPNDITQGMQFWNADGGTIWSWGFPGTPQKLRCDDDHREESIIFRWGEDVSWFPHWRRCRWTHHQWRVEPC